MDALGHRQYLAFLAVAGREFSPLHPLVEPLRLGGREFWTVEGLWQGSKIVRVRDPAMLEPSDLRFETISAGLDGVEIWFPLAGSVREAFLASIYFRCLKSSRKYNRIRDRQFGRGNWTFSGHYCCETGQVISERARAIELIHRPAYRAQLAQRWREMDHLRCLLREGRVTITEAMLAAHPHLHAVQAAL
jgi:hypothetical protein